MPTRCYRWYLLQMLLLAQHVSGTIMPIIRSSRVLYRWSLPVVFGALVFKLSVWCGAEGCVSGLQAAASAPHHTDNLKTKAPNTTGSNNLYNTLELLIMGIMVPETCWASNKFCNKNHLLHLVGIYFHIVIEVFKKIPAFLRKKWRNRDIYLTVWYKIHKSNIQQDRQCTYSYNVTMRRCFSVLFSGEAKSMYNLGVCL